VSRQLLLKTFEAGDLELFLIYQYGEEWEEEWRPLQHENLVSLVTVVSQETMDHALHGLSLPLVRALGISPEGALRKLPSKTCERKKTCPFYRKKDCHPLAGKMPWCFEPEGIGDPVARQLAGNLIGLWRKKVYILVVVHAQT
jgi:hypothetical protein